MKASSIPTVVVNSYAEILERLKRHGPPAPGMKRMFRGQIKGYVDVGSGLPSLLPAMVRAGSDQTYDPAWLVSTQMYSMAVDEHGASTPLDHMYIWGPALLQHYGPGSCYLDVTSDLDVALWFALHKRYEKWVAVKGGAGMARSICCSWYKSPSLNDLDVAPVLYVFDAASWNGEGAPAQAELVELTALDVAGKLPDEARRLHRQVGSLLYADIKKPEGPNLGTDVVAMMVLTPAFDLHSVPSFGRTATDLFPTPASDHFYRSLLEVPAQLRFDPTRLEHPLAVPCYLDEPPALLVAETHGDRQAPIELTDLEATQIAGLGAFVELGAAMKPALMYEFVVLNSQSFGEPMIPTTADGRQFRLKDATPFFMEGPLWSYLPSCHSEEARGEWIQSALPIGIAPQLGNRPTDNVYVEMSTLDALYPQKEVPGMTREGSAVRGIWLAHSGNRYWCTVYRTGDGGGVFSHAAEFRFVPHVGKFVRVAPEKENSLTQAEREALQSHFDVVEKALFTTLLLLRDLSPGFKPPSTYSGCACCDDGSYFRLVGSVLEPQLGNIHRPASAPFLVPRALNGSTYARASGSGTIDPDEWKKSEDGFVAMRNAVRDVKDPFYALEAGAELGDMCAERGQFKEALNAVRGALAWIPGMPASPYTQSFGAVLEVLQGRILFCLNDHPNSLSAFHRAMKIQEASGNEERLVETRRLVDRIFPPPLVHPD